MTASHISAVGAATVLLTSCMSTAIPEGEGKGLVSVDKDPPADARIAERPEWHVGDRFGFRRGGQVSMVFRVTEKGDEGYQVAEETTGLVVFLDRDLGQLGQEAPAAPMAKRVLAPYDKEFTWPLWEGKQWTCHYIRKAPGAALPIMASYRCGKWETLTVGAGTFDCLRIWRTSRPAVEGTYLERVDVIWYAPEVGYYARKLVDGTLTELQSFQRQ